MPLNKNLNTKQKIIVLFFTLSIFGINYLTIIVKSQKITQNLICFFIKLVKLNFFIKFKVIY